MNEEFYNWLIAIGRTPNTAYSYTNAINRISTHYSNNIGRVINIYQIENQTEISEIARKYRLDGIYADEGNTGNGTWRNAIARYAEFFIQRANNGDQQIGNNIEENTEEQQINFAYERDLQRTLCAQIPELFPDYNIYGVNNQGIEYVIEGRRIDVLLEHSQNQNLLVVELKSGESGYEAFGQISMYMGLLKNAFPQKDITGVIIAGSINQGLQHACNTTDRITLKVYRMQLELEDV